MEKYVRQGGILIGLKPTSPEGLIPSAGMDEFHRITNAMWGECGTDHDPTEIAYGRGRIYCTQDAHAAFAALHLPPDFDYRADDAGVAFDYVHRQTQDADLYFVRNENDTPAAATKLRIASGV